MDIQWEDGFEISVKSDPDSGEITVLANREGMLSLARILTRLADGTPGSHIHLDQYNSLEDGSSELIIEVIE